MKDLIKDLKYANNNLIEYQEAKRLKKRGLKIGLSILIGGFVGIVIFFGLSALFFLNGKIAFGVVSCVFSFLCFGVVSFGIIITGYASNVQLNNEQISTINQEQNTCPNCGAELHLDSSFCESCGTKIKK